MKFSSFSLVPVALLIFTGAGCSSSSTTSPTPPAPSGYTADALLPSSGDQASKVPSDIPVYPGGTVIAVTGDVNVAQLTVDKSDRVITWIKAEYERRGVTFKKTSQEGSSTNLVFESADKRYNVRVDQPRDGGNAFLTISRGTKDAVMGE